ncbi:MAG: undecaprenyl-diphosphate phosphatase [Asgard group archaeon]|nr:undecaprenyl-diphosphate phosphatase [Asgard group archaeon]
MVALWIITILAIAQGILEWLPVSSEGQLVLILNWLNESENALAIALFMHIGTMIAVIIRFRKDLIMLFDFRKREKQINNEQIKQNNDEKEIEALQTNNNLSQKEKQKILWKFLLLATLATAVIGIPIYALLKYVILEESLSFANGAISSGDIVTMLIGLFLIGTGIFIFVSKKKTTSKSLFEMNTVEMLIIGAVQGLAIIPGVSRSGSTVGTMLIEGVNEEDALRGSFLLSIPAVIGGNILIIIIDLIQGETSFAEISAGGMVLAVFLSAVVGYFTIDVFLRLAKKINFGWFCIFIGTLALVITLIIIILNLTTI